MRSGKKTNFCVFLRLHQNVVFEMFFQQLSNVIFFQRKIHRRRWRDDFFNPSKKTLHLNSHLSTHQWSMVYGCHQIPFSLSGSRDLARAPRPRALPLGIPPGGCREAGPRRSIFSSSTFLSIGSTLERSKRCGWHALTTELVFHFEVLWRWLAAEQ